MKNLISVYIIESYRQVYRDQSKEYDEGKVNERYIYFEHHEIRSSEKIDIKKEFGYDSLQEYVENFDENGERANCVGGIVNGEVDIRLDNGEIIIWSEEPDEVFNYEFTSSDPLHEDDNIYLFLQDAKKALKKLKNQSIDYGKNQIEIDEENHTEKEVYIDMGYANLYNDLEFNDSATKFAKSIINDNLDFNGLSKTVETLRLRIDRKLEVESFGKGQPSFDFYYELVNTDIDYIKSYLKENKKYKNKSPSIAGRMKLYEVLARLFHFDKSKFYEIRQIYSEKKIKKLDFKNKKGCSKNSILIILIICIFWMWFIFG